MTKTISQQQSHCEVCQTDIKGIKNWMIHIKTDSHLSNVVKFLQYDLGALTIDDIPKKLDEMFE